MVPASLVECLTQGPHADLKRADNTIHNDVLLFLLCFSVHNTDKSPNCWRWSCTWLTQWPLCTSGTISNYRSWHCTPIMNCIDVPKHLEELTLYGAPLCTTIVYEDITHKLLKALLNIPHLPTHMMRLKMLLSCMTNLHYIISFH